MFKSGSVFDLVLQCKKKKQYLYISANDIWDTFWSLAQCNTCWNALHLISLVLVIGYNVSLLSCSERFESHCWQECFEPRWSTKPIQIKSTMIYTQPIPCCSYGLVLIFLFTWALKLGRSLINLAYVWCRLFSFHWKCSCTKCIQIQLFLFHSRIYNAFHRLLINFIHTCIDYDVN